MAAKCVSAKCTIKSIYDKALTADALKQMKETVQKAVDAKKPTLELKDSCKEGFFLTVSLDSLTVDDEEKPTSIEAKVSVTGVALGGTATGFKASGSAKASGINARKMEGEVEFVVDSALGDLMADKVVPQMMK